jgi:hypothetical protein
VQQQEEQARRQWGELNRRMDALDVIDDSRRGAAAVGVSDAAFTQWALAQVCARGRERERGGGPGGLTREVETPLPSNHP